MLRLEVDAQPTTTTSSAPSSQSSTTHVSSTHSSSTSSAALPSLNELYRHQLLGLQPSHSSRHLSTSASSFATTAATAPTFSPSLTPVAARTVAVVPPLSSRQSFSSSVDELLPSSARQSLSAARPSISRTSTGPQPTTVDRQSLPSSTSSPSAAGMGVRGGALRPARTSLGQQSSAHKLALHPSTAQHIAKHQSQTTTLAAAQVLTVLCVLLTPCRTCVVFCCRTDRFTRRSRGVSHSQPAALVAALLTVCTLRHLIRHHCVPVTGRTREHRSQYSTLTQPLLSHTTPNRHNHESQT